MNKILVGVTAVALVGGGLWYFRSDSGEAAPAGAAAGATPGAAAGGRGGAPGAGGARGGRGAVPMSVDVSTVGRSEVVDYVTVVGNLIGKATVDVVPRVAGRLETVNVQLGDRVTRGQTVAKLEDRAIREQVNQVRANIEVNQATLKARENDAIVAKNSLDRARTSFERGLLSQQGLEDAEARYNSAISQVTVAQAQLVSTQARLDELSVTLSDTSVVSPVDGFVGRRNLDSGAFAGGNTAIISVVDIGIVRMVANLVEKDFRRVQAGAPALVEVDAFPGEQFTGHVSRVAPVFDPATRTATMEIEVPNPGYRLKPGMYARVRLTAERKPDALTVARAAVVDIQGRRGVYVVEEGDVARFREVETGLSDTERIEILSGVPEGTRVVTTGALAIRDGERILTADAARARGGAPRGGAPGAGNGRAQGTGPSSRGSS
ncbi:MAG: efflux RND transporter periplasmic adaptor subunit [Acidobacteria bacterium]|nr:efflux RND transporter periplasmic adaptor subunit [Acidobacteriota bacterium]